MSTEPMPDDGRPRNAWDRWQNLRTPETIEEAEAAIALARMKIAALERAAERECVPEFVARWTYPLGRWRDELLGLEWALAVLRAGDSPALRKLAALQARYDAALRDFARCPDAAALIALLQRRLQANDLAREELTLEVTSLHYVNDELRAKLKAARAQQNGGDRGK